MEFQDISLITGYHAHVYFDESTVEQAKALCNILIFSFVLNCLSKLSFCKILRLN